MIHIADTKVARRYGDFFIRQIHKFEEVSSDVCVSPCTESLTCYFKGLSFFQHGKTG